MPDNPKHQDLSAVLAKLEKEWRELATLLEGRAQSSVQTLETGKIILRDASGVYRGQISVEEDGSAGIFLSDQEGKAWAVLGVDESGQAFVELKDRQREIRFKVPVGPPFAGTPAEGGAAAAAMNPEATPEASGPAEAPAPSGVQPEAAGPPPGEPAEVAGPANPPGEGPAGSEAEVLRRLEKLERRQRWQGVAWICILALLGLVLATQALLLSRFNPFGPLTAQGLAGRDPQGVLRAWLGEADGQVGLKLRDQKGKVRLGLGLDAQGSPDLTFYDRDQRARMQLKLKPDGEPQVTGLPGPKAKSRAEGTGPAQAPAAAAKPPASKAKAVPEVFYVGAKNSNKYHYPTCKWAKKIGRGNMIIFKSPEEARAHHYIPCPVCKPPPLSK